MFLSEPLYQIIENVLRKIIGVPPVSQRDTLISKVLEYYKSYFYFQKRRKYIETILSKESIKVTLVFDCRFSIISENWKTDIQRNDRIPYEIIIIETSEDIEILKTNLQNYESDYYILFDRPSIFEKLGLHEILLFINENPDIKLFFTDHWENSGGKKTHVCKPSFNEDYYLAYNFIQLPLIIERVTLIKIVKNTSFKIENSSWIYDVVLFASLNYKIERLESLTTVTTSYLKNQISQIQSDRRKSIIEFLEIKKTSATVEYVEPSVLHINRELTTQAMVSIIIPFKDQVELLKICIQSIIDNTKYNNYEILLINNNSENIETHSYLKEITTERNNNIYCHEYNLPFNYSAINNWAAKQTKAEYLLFLNNDTIVINKGWVTNMCKHIQRETVGAVGALLLYPDHTVQHAGVIIGIGHFAGHSHRHLSSNSNGYMQRLICDQEVSAVTGACLLTKSNIFELLDGFDEKNLPISNNDVDYCLRLIKNKYKIIFTPKSKLFHLESKSRSSDTSSKNIKRYKSELSYIRKKFKSNDKFYNKALTRTAENFTISKT